MRRIIDSHIFFKRLVTNVSLENIAKYNYVVLHSVSMEWVYFPVTFFSKNKKNTVKSRKKKKNYREVQAGSAKIL